MPDKKPDLDRGGIRWACQSPGNSARASGCENSRDWNEWETAADVSFAWDGSLLQIKDGRICGLEALGDEALFPAAIRKAQREGERFIQLYYTESAVAALSESGRLYSSTGFRRSMTDSKNSVLEHMSAPVDSVLEYKGKLRFLAGEDSVPSAANALLVERSDEAGDEAGYWTCMVELLLKERCPNERLD